MKRVNWTLVVLVLIGFVIGRFIGTYFDGSFLNYGQTFGLSSPIELNLGFIILTFGLKFQITIASVLGVIIRKHIYAGSEKVLDRSAYMKREKETIVPNKPYEKFLAYGPEHLTESELLAIILRTGTKEASAVELAEQVLKLAKAPREGLLGLYDITLEGLMQIRGIGEVKAVKLKCLTELSMRISRATAKEGINFNDSVTVADYFMEQLRHKDTEYVILVSLDNKGQMLKESLLSHGSVRMSLISPREIFLEALQQKAVNILLVHNHPSGDPTPSNSDLEMTRNVKEVGEMMGIELLDHIIIGDNRYTSFKELALL